MTRRGGGCATTTVDGGRVVGGAARDEAKGRHDGGRSSKDGEAGGAHGEEDESIARSPSGRVLGWSLFLASSSASAKRDISDYNVLNVAL
jgi:hypothetical protein